MTEESNYKRSSEIYHEILNELLILYRKQNAYDYKLNQRIDKLETELKIFHLYIKTVRGDALKSDDDRYYNSTTEEVRDNLNQLKCLLLDENKTSLKESNNFNFYFNLFKKNLDKYNEATAKKNISKFMVTSFQKS